MKELNKADAIMELAKIAEVYEQNRHMMALNPQFTDQQKAAASVGITRAQQAIKQACDALEPDMFHLANQTIEQAPTLYYGPIGLQYYANRCEMCSNDNCVEMDGLKLHCTLCGQTALISSVG